MLKKILEIHAPGGGGGGGDDDEQISRQLSPSQDGTRKWPYHSEQSYLKISKCNILLVNIYFVKIKLICYTLFSGLI